MGADALGMPMPPAPPMFPSTDPGMLAQVVQDALSQQAQQDHMMLEAQQQQAAIAAQPIIDQMLATAAGAPEMGAMAPQPDPMMAYGAQAGLPPMPTEAGF